MSKPERRRTVNQYQFNLKTRQGGAPVAVVGATLGVSPTAAPYWFQRVPAPQQGASGPLEQAIQLSGQRQCLDLHNQEGCIAWLELW